MTLIRELVTGIAIGLIAFGFVFATQAHAEEDRPAQILVRLREVSDQQLSDRLNGLLSKDDFRREFEYEACLTEIVRRGTKQGAVMLRRCFDVLMDRKFKLFEGSDETEPGSTYNLELLTALRRANMQPDPLTIVVERGDRLLTATPLSLPRLKVSIKNVDIERKEVGFTFGGNYRSGRQARWRLAVVDDKGNTVPTKQPDGLIITGGLSSEGRLKHGESWETVIDMREFIEAPLPGRYQLRVLYHNTRTILYSEDISGLIVCRSDRIAFVVSPTVIQLTEKQKRTAHEWIAALEPTKRVKVVAGTYGKWAHDFIRPESPQGKLLGMGLKAAPPLIEALQDEATSAEKRSWILSLLYSVTGKNDPCYRGVLASYDYVEAPWQVWGGAPGETPSGGIGFASKGGGGFLGGTIDANEQDQMTKNWIEWLQTVKVKVAEDE